MTSIQNGSDETLRVVSNKTKPQNQPAQREKETERERERESKNESESEKEREREGASERGGGRVIEREGARESVRERERAPVRQEHWLPSADRAQPAPATAYTSPCQSCCCWCHILAVPRVVVAGALKCIYITTSSS